MSEALTLPPPQKTQRRQPRQGMIWVRGGQFRMGSDTHHPEEGPQRTVSVDGFWIDASPVTNRQFERFVQSASYVTTAERALDPDTYPDAPSALLGPASLVFRPPLKRQSDCDSGDWWSFVQGADWRHPLGPGSSLLCMEDHPVVHVSWEDVSAYCAWARTDLPTEAEWEFAARGGLEGAAYAWGDEPSPGGVQMANIWQGRFPFESKVEGGWARTSPVGSFPANGHGLYDMIGNTWEWTRDWWSTRTGAIAAVRCCSTKNRTGGSEALSDDPALAHLKVPRRVLKGGSHLCAANYCGRFRPAARQPMSIDTAASHVGFRCVVRPAMMR